MGNEKLIPKTVKVPESLDEEVYRVLRLPGLEEYAYSDFIRDAMRVYTKILRVQKFSDQHDLTLPNDDG